MARSTAAVKAARQQQKARKNSFDPSKMKVLYEADPIVLERDGVLSVQAYSYDGGEVKISVYRVGISTKTGKPWQVRDLRPMDHEIALLLAEKLQEVAEWVANNV